MELIKQEVSQERWIDIPEPVRDVYRLWRPDAALPRASAREGARYPRADLLQVRGRVARPGSHKPNTAVRAGVLQQARKACGASPRRPGAGQWGSALSLACQIFGIECKVYMVQGLLPPEAVPAHHDGGVGRAGGGEPVATRRPPAARCSRRIRTRPAASASRSRRRSRRPPQREDTKYSLGSVLNHVLMHQTVIGLEAKRQLEMAGDRPDIVIGCIGGGSNFGGFVVPLPAGQADREAEGPAHHRRRAATRPRASPRASTSTTSATPDR